MKKIGLILFTVIIAACGSKKDEQKEPEQKPDTTGNLVHLTDVQAKNAGIETGKLVMKNISSLLKVTGKIDVPPQNIVSISVPLGGYLQSSKLLPGMHVSKGETLALMQDPQYIQLQQDYLTAKTKLAYAEQEYNR